MLIRSLTRNISNFSRKGLFSLFSSQQTNKPTILSPEEINKQIQDITFQCKQDDDWLQSDIGKQTLLAFFSSNIPTTKTNHPNIEEYIQTRLKYQNLSQENLFFAQRTISNLLSYPLTLSYALSNIFPMDFPFYKDHLNVLVIGARSEASLPLIWWKEALHSHHMHIPKTTLRMIGPNLIPNNKLQQQNHVIWRDEASKHQSKEEYQLHVINNAFDPQTNDKELFHLHPHAHELLQWADCFMLFHPGYGSHEALKESWKQTFALLFASHKPIVCSAFSDIDLQRDLDTLRELAEEHDDQDLGNMIEMICLLKTNPFKSLKTQVYVSKQLQTNEFHTLNHSLYAFQSK